MASNTTMGSAYAAPISKTAYMTAMFAPAVSSHPAVSSEVISAMVLMVMLVTEAGGVLLPFIMLSRKDCIGKTAAAYNAGSLSPYAWISNADRYMQQ
jgi:hypothetical protein